jgi:hypothetical protein
VVTELELVNAGLKLIVERTVAQPDRFKLRPEVARCA